VRPNNPTAAGFHGNFFELTLGLNWTPHANFIVRPEVRYDWFDGGTFSPRNPFDNGFDENDNDQFLAALDVIFLW